MRQIALSLGRAGTIEHLQLFQNHVGKHFSKTTLYKAAVHFFSRGIIPRSLVSECCRALMSTNPSERQTAAVALLRIRPPELVLPHLSILLSVSDSPDPVVRYTIARLLRELTFPQKNKLYHRYISDSGWRVRYEAALAIPFLTIADSSWVMLLNDQHPYDVAAPVQTPPT
ncbi:MAG: HEAT repeat domain-containing protein, partial [Candidatus Marinimicrobia bacterium]|nr:HEAT repeat domain-containing protein [Candidatus Neomarinimicrobiota bacterium]